MARLIAITGGIGSGKSVVAQLLRVMGYGVYDCDSRAKELMASSPELRRDLIAAFGADVYTDGGLNRPYLAARVFADAAALAHLNSIVHPAVVADIKRWRSATKPHRGLLFVETAVLRESGVERLVDGVIVVTAPTELRIARVMSRNGATREQVEARIAAQGDFLFPDSRVIVNDERHALIPQLRELLNHYTC